MGKEKAFSAEGAQEQSFASKTARKLFCRAFSASRLLSPIGQHALYLRDDRSGQKRRRRERENERWHDEWVVSSIGFNMTWTLFVFDVSLLVFVTCNVVVLYHVIPAYQRTKNRAFMWLTLSSLLGIFNSAMIHTIGRQHLSHNDYLAYVTLRNLTAFASVILGTIGVVHLTRPFLRSSADPNREPSGNSSVD